MQKSINIFILLYIQIFIHVTTSLVRRIEQSLSYTIEIGFTTEKKYKTGVRSNKQTSIKQAEVAKNPEIYK